MMMVVLKNILNNILEFKGLFKMDLIIYFFCVR